MGKFTNSLNIGQDQKLMQTLKRTNEALNKDLETSKKKIEELKNVLLQAENSGSTSFIDLKDIELVRNIRNNYHYEDIEDLAQSIYDNGQIQAVTLTSDNYLISGHRRYYAIQALGKNYNKPVVAVKLDKSFKEIGQETFDRLQLEENEQRKNLDNFQIANLFNSYIEKSYTQTNIVAIFGKSKGYVSECLSITKIDYEIEKILKEIQYFGMSKKKFAMANLDIKPNSIILGRRLLYNIAISDNQSQEFINLFNSKLTAGELEIFGNRKIIKTETSKIDLFTKSINTKFDSLKKNYKDEKYSTTIKDVEHLLLELNNKLEFLK